MRVDVTSPAGAARPRRRRGGWLLAPLVLWLGLFVVAPAAILLVDSFCERDELGRVVRSFTLKNYRRVFTATYLAIFARSVGYAGLATAICLGAGFPVAWWMARLPPPWRERGLVLVMIPFWTSFLIRTYAWITILKSEGLLNALLRAAALSRQPLKLLYTPTAVVIGLVYAYLPFMILPIYASAEKVPPEVIEAAHDLGCGPVAVFGRVILPLVRPGICGGILLVFVPAIGMFAITDLLGGARVPLLGGVIQNQFFQARDWPFGAALGMVFLVLFIMVYYLLQRLGARRLEDA